MSFTCLFRKLAKIIVAFYRGTSVLIPIFIVRPIIVYYSFLPQCVHADQLEYS